MLLYKYIFLLAVFLQKDFENFELKLTKLREEARESFDRAEKHFDENYLSRLEEIFPRDILGAKKLIKGSFLIDYVDSYSNPPNTDHNSVPLNKGERASKGNRGISEIFQDAVQQVIKTLPLSHKRQQTLSQNILRASELSESLQSYFATKDDISRDPFFALVEDFSMDGDISKEEFLLLQQSYESEGDFIKSLQALPENIQALFHAHIEMTLSHEHSLKRGEFEGEYARELQALREKGVNIEPVVVFVSRFYYKTSGKYKKFEHPKRRMRRTFKIALLKLLRIKLGNIDAQILLDRFEAGESFEDFFMILFKLLEVINEDPSGEEIYSILKLEEEIQDDVFTAEENKQKILAGESLVMKIASLFGKGHHDEGDMQLDDGMLDKLLEETTDIVGDDIYFNREQENAGIYAEQDDEDESEEEELDYDSMAPQVAYEMLEHEFHTIEEEKRKAFLGGEYDAIDIFNEKLLVIESKLSKLCNILGKEL